MYFTISPQILRLVAEQDFSRNIYWQLFKKIELCIYELR